MSRFPDGGWSLPYNFGALPLPPGWSVRYMEYTGMWYAVRGDDPDEGNTNVCFGTPHSARRHAIAIARATDPTSEGHT